MVRLEEIFRMQDVLNQRIELSPPPPTDEEKAKWILNYTRAMQQETAGNRFRSVEMAGEIPEIRRPACEGGSCRPVYFLVSPARTLGMTADAVYQAYLKKNQVNHQRQESGSVKKDEADSKHI